MKIGVIGGTAVFPLELLEDKKEINVETPFGKPSDSITVGKLGDKEIFVLSRHGKKHTIHPGNINYRANIHALKSLGVERIISPSAVGSLQDDIEPGTFVSAYQFIDRTTRRVQTFHEDRVCHISVADPFCKQLRDLLKQSVADIPFKENGTYLCIEGPRFSTRAESRMFRHWGADIIGMTLVPEVVLAREAGICYASIGMVTDYDTFKEQSVSIGKVLEVVKQNENKIKTLVKNLIDIIPERNCECGSFIKEALM